MDGRINFDMLASMPVPSNLLKSTRYFVPPKMTIIILIYLKLLMDFITAMVLVLGVDYSIKNECCLDYFCGSLFVAMMVVVCSDVQLSIVKAIRLRNTSRIRLETSDYSVCRQAVIGITFVSLCMSVSLPNTSNLKFNIVPYRWFDIILYLVLVTLGLLWLGMDYILIWKVTKDYYSFEEVILNIFKDNALKQCTCDMKTGNTKLPLKTIAEENAQPIEEKPTEQQNVKV